MKIKAQHLTINEESVDGVIGIRTRGLVVCEVPEARLTVNDKQKQLILMKSISILNHGYTFVQK